MDILDAGIRGLASVICCLCSDPPAKDVYPPLLPNRPAQQHSQRPPHTSTAQPGPIAPLVSPPPPSSNEPAQEQQQLPPRAGTPQQGSIAQYVPPPPPLSNRPAKWPPLQQSLIAPSALPLPCGHEGRPTVAPVLQPPREHGDRFEQRADGAQHAHSTRRPLDDLNNADEASPYPAGLRARAEAEHFAREEAMQERRKAEQDGNIPLSKQLWNKAQEHKAEMQRLNAEAAKWIFDTNNRDRTSGEVDVHGLHVQEAIKHTKLAVEEAKARGQSELRIIVGKGLHSEDHKAKLKPAIRRFLKVQQPACAVRLDPNNSGVIIVRLVRKVL
ncbi:DUF1771 and SMR domain-containing protein [Phanerochaete sordida]|uniref:DUF1771 and SMR domain-containing protein n=1 Tax=Phanerochaete sordida TaxID=48140 RepID=A0A9P3LCD9_9APHY|nr:DUF1771 and SMR domain-containing protein [Phanerochaete sordida]